MDVLLHITTPDAAPIATALAKALSTEGASWACFMTNDGVKVMDAPDFVAVLRSATRAAVCEHSSARGRRIVPQST